MFNAITRRIKGLASGVWMGGMAFVMAPMSIKYMITGETGGSGAGPALATFALTAMTICSAVLLVLCGVASIPLQAMGVPWFVSIPAGYFGVWALLGATVFCE